MTPTAKWPAWDDILTYTIQWVNDAVDENGNATAATVTVTEIHSRREPSM